MPASSDPPADRIALRVTPDALRQIRGGHPWVYDSSITAASREGVAGDMAVVFDDRRRFAAIGLWDPLSPIRLRVLHHGRPVPIDRTFWRARIGEAVQRRAPLLERGDTDGVRLVNGESDGMPGLVLDAYDRTLVLKLYTAAWARHLADVVEVVAELLHPEAMVLRLARNIDATAMGGLEEGDALIGTTPDAPVLFRENGLVFEADVVHGQKTGHFLDQRDNRRRVGERARGARVLDLFASTGGFSVHAAAGGASEVVAVDLSGPTLEVAARNLAHNANLPAVRAVRYQPVVADAFEELQRLRHSRARFDVVVVDPPSFTPRQTSVPRALAAYARLTSGAVGVLRPGGLLVQCSCSSRVGAEQFHATVARAAEAAGRPVHVIERTGHAPDHPVTFAEGAYLKAVFATVD